VNAQKKFDLSKLNSNRTRRKWGDNNTVDLRDIVDVEIEGDKYDKDFMEYVHGHFLIVKSNQPSKLASFDPKVLKMPLTKACSTTKSLVKDACQMSKNITGFLGARKTGKHNFGHAEKIFRYVLLNLYDKSKEDLPPLCDEIYCQLIKMTTSCPEQAIELKGFQLMAILSAVFPCSPELFPYVMSHCEIKKKLKGQDDQIKQLAWKTQRALRRGQDLPLRRLPKGVVPTEAETASIMAMAEVAVRVFMEDGSSVVLPIASYTTASQLADMMARTLQIRQAHIFAIYEVDETNKQNALKADERILDRLAIWQFRADTAMEADEGLDRVRSGDLSSHFLYRVKFYPHTPPKDDAGCLQYMYIQAVEDVIHGRHPSDIKDCIDLAALQLQEEEGDFKEDKKHILEGQLQRYMPAEYLVRTDNAGRKKICDFIMRRYRVLTRTKQFGRFECQMGYLNLFKEWLWYGARSFDVECSRVYPGLPPMFHLVICPERILFVDIETRQLFKKLEMKTLKNFGGEGQYLKLKLDTEIRMLRTEIGEAEQIVELLDEYRIKSARRGR